jgi:hypothetical protein
LSEEEYITFDDVAARLNVTKGTLYYYTKRLNIPTKKFDLDRHVYIKVSDFERIKSLKERASKQTDEPENPAA